MPAVRGCKPIGDCLTGCIFNDWTLPVASVIVNLNCFARGLHIMVEVGQETSELIPTSECLETLGINKSAFYDRMNFLGLQPVKRGRNSFLKPPDLQLLMELGEHISATGSMDGFGKLAIQSSEMIDPWENGSELVEPDDWKKEGEDNSRRQWDGILRSAKEHRAGIEMAKYAIAEHLKVEDLDPDLIEQVDAVRARTLPKSVPPAMTAGVILKQYMSGRI
ncbi:hypothetical protein [Limnospira sp. Paracas R14]|uniref:hypothetical protein n=2 Tax=unclassified Limnospira TaxID=2642885 RepID=UPI0028E12A5D|nr:hypothetical protein [Limnospira sp. Paracas R14]